VPEIQHSNTGKSCLLSHGTCQRHEISRKGSNQATIAWRPKRNYTIIEQQDEEIHSRSPVQRWRFCLLKRLVVVYYISILRTVDSTQNTGSNRSYSQHRAQHLMKTAVRCDVVSLNILHSKCPILVKRTLTYILLTHDCLFEKPLCYPNHLKNIIGCIKK
jgi:hypothetical protein